MKAYATGVMVIWKRPHFNRYVGRILQAGSFAMRRSLAVLAKYLLKFDHPGPTCCSHTGKRGDDICAAPEIMAGMI